MAKTLSNSEKELIELLYRDKTPITVIAKELGRTPQTIHNHINRAGLRNAEKVTIPQTEVVEETSVVASEEVLEEPEKKHFFSKKRKTTNIRRGDIFYVVKSPHQCGAEQEAGRPAIIVSNNRCNMTSDIIQVVFLTTKDKKPLPTHVTIHSTGIKSTALCEQVQTVSKMRVTEFCGTCNEAEMSDINSALLISLALENVEQKVSVESTVTIAENRDCRQILFERDFYKNCFEELLEKLVRR